MGAYRSINMIIALVWLYIAFAVTVLFNLHNDATPTEPNNPVSTSVVVTLSEAQIRGKNLFKSNCATCHAKNMTTDLTGPALKGVTERWADYPNEDLYSWIKNSDKLKAAKHPKAVSISKEWKNAPMTTMEHLSEADISDILLYIER